MKMGKYGKCAKMAVDLIQRQEAADPVAAWDKAALSIFSDSESSRKKGCPKNTFLGLCDEGIVKNISSGNRTKSLENKKYAIDAVNLLKKNPNLSKDEKSLWAAIQGNTIKQHNAQMDVVTALWDNGMIEVGKKSHA